jgi:hypothetical protein
MPWSKIAAGHPYKHPMIHPHSELRFVSSEIGFGVFATRLIPKGTITWVFDPLDQIIVLSKSSQLPTPLQRQLDIYSYRNGRGERILCWDLARFVNHSCHPTSIAPGLDLEIAVRDIEPEEQLTDDYGTLNIDSDFECACGYAECRGIVGPADFERLSGHWDGLVASAFPLVGDVEQPLWELIQERPLIESILTGESHVPSCRVHSLGAANGRC